MKTITYFTILISMTCSLLRLKAQDPNSRLRAGFEFCYFQPSTFKDGVLPSLTVSLKNKYMFNVGAMMVYYDNYHPRPLAGVHGGYRFFPNTYNEKFSLFFEVSINCVKGTLHDDFRYNYIYGSQNVGKRTVNLLAIDTYQGFGFQWNIFRNFYTMSSAGIGLGVSKEEYTYYYNGTIWEGKGNLRPRQIQGVNAMFKLGIGYYFLNLKNKEVVK